jgi:hypothetical protein
MVPPGDTGVTDVGMCTCCPGTVQQKHCSIFRVPPYLPLLFQASKHCCRQHQSKVPPLLLPRIQLHEA